MTALEYGSVCSGVEAVTVAVEPLGWRAAWFAEIEPQPSAVLAHHYPSVSNLGDMTKLAARVLTGEIAAPDVLVGGTPCQSYSVAGRREGLSDPRGQLTIAFLDLADAIDTTRLRLGKPPCIIWWENVPGVLSSKDNAYGCFLAGLAGEDGELQPPRRVGKSKRPPKWANAGCVFGPQRTIAWRTLDAQYFGLAQRRRRVFVVASARAGFSPVAVLLEREGMRRDSAPSRSQGVQGADDVGASTSPASRWWDGGQISQTLDAVLHKSQTLPEKNRFPAVLQPVCMTGVITHTLTADGHDGSEDGSGRGIPIVAHPIAFTYNDYARDAGELCPTLRSGAHMDSHANSGIKVAIAHAMNTIEWIVRFLTPREGERLQGFPDDYTLVPYKGGQMKAGPRRKMIGNSMAVPVMRWIGNRIATVVKGAN